MVNRVTMTLDQKEYSALLRIAEKELRNPPDQARVFVRDKLKEYGLLRDVVESSLEIIDSEPR